ncbi:MAG: MMPL family transporter [Pseudomonadota bacterium]
MNQTPSIDSFRPVATLDEFNAKSGNLLERLLFNHRAIVVLVCALLTVILGVQACGIRLNASFVKTIPNHHAFVANYLKNESQLKGLANAVRVAVAVDGDGDIYNPRYLDILRNINDELYLVAGVDRAYMRSIWTPATRWLGVTEDGFDGGPVIPENYDGSAHSIESLRNNVEKSGEIGQLVAPDGKSSMVYLPLLDINPETGQRLDYKDLSAALEKIRGKYEAQGVKLHITGFAKVMGDLIEGLKAMLVFFAIAIVITAGTLYYFTRCVRSTALVLGCTLVGIVWLLGILPVIGYELNPYLILIPFLVYAIGVSHGAQKMNGIMQDIGRGTHKLIAARYTFRRLFLAGATALMADAIGFAVLSLVDIPVIQELAIVASIGVGILVFTNLALLPVLLSYTGVSPAAAQRSLKEEKAAGDGKSGLWKLLDRFTGRRYALLALVASSLLGAGGYMVSQQLKIGDLDRGAPELRANSRYNRDNDFIINNYAASSDVLVTMVRTRPGQCSAYETLLKVDELEWRLRQLPGVEGTNSLAALSKRAIAGMNEGSLKWHELVGNQELINSAAARAPRELFNETCDFLSVYAYLKDHKADTLSAVVQLVDDFAKQNNTGDVEFMLAAGNAGIEAATNIVVKDANGKMLAGVYIAVLLLCAVTFRSWRAVLCAVLPLALTSILAEALMVVLGIGVKVSTLPVIALGVGIGVDYALYILSVTQDWMKRGASLSTAYFQALLFTGRVVLFTGITLSLGVMTWVFSPIKFQADMGILLTFMFVWNMLGALILIPALACFLLPQKRGVNLPKETTAPQSAELA